MADIWMWADQHFSHKNILTFKDKDDKLIRGDRFSSVEEMNEYMINEHNKLVKPQDKVYYLGDVCMGSSVKDGVLYRLTGHKRLILGNHDNIKNVEFAKHFDKIDVWRIFKDWGFVCTHVPLREDQFRDGAGFNVHGHLHQNVIDSKFHTCVSVEQTDFRPLHIEEVKDRINKINGNNKLEIKPISSKPVGYVDQ